MRKESDTVRKILAEDGLPQWRPDPAKLPPQAPVGASMSELLKEVPPGGIAWLAFGNSGVTEMLMNWVPHISLYLLTRSLPRSPVASRRCSCTGGPIPNPDREPEPEPEPEP